MYSQDTLERASPMCFAFGDEPTLRRGLDGVMKKCDMQIVYPVDLDADMINLLVLQTSSKGEMFMGLHDSPRQDCPVSSSGYAVSPSPITVNRPKFIRSQGTYKYLSGENPVSLKALLSWRNKNPSVRQMLRLLIQKFFQMMKIVHKRLGIKEVSAVLEKHTSVTCHAPHLPSIENDNDPGAQQTPLEYKDIALTKVAPAPEQQSSASHSVQLPNPRAEVVFSSDVRNMYAWSRQTRIPLTTAEALGAAYARAHGWLQNLRLQLTHHHNWRDAPSSDHRMLFSLETSAMWRSSVALPAGPALSLHLPVHASSFFSPGRRIQWQRVFHTDIFESLRKTCPPINDILNLVQCLLTGVVTLVFEEREPAGVYRTIRGLPPVSWVNANEEALREVFGTARVRALRKACSSTDSAYKLERLL